MEKKRLDQTGFKQIQAKNDGWNSRIFEPKELMKQKPGVNRIKTIFVFKKSLN